MLVSDCFKNFFGLRQSGCNQIAPQSNLFIDDISGIDLLSFVNNGNGTYANHEQLIEAKLNLSLETIKSDLALGISSLGYMIQPEKDIKTIFCLKEPTVSITNTSFNGVRLKRANTSNDLVVVDISTVSVYPSTNGTLTLRFVNNTKVVFETSADVVANTPFVFHIPNTAQRHTGNVEVLIGGTASLHDTTINCNTDKNPCRLCYCDCNNKQTPIYTVESLQNGVVMNNNSAYGLIVEVSTYCDLSVFLCKYKEVIKMPLYYKLAYFLLIEFGTPVVLSTFNATDADKNNQAEYWEKLYKNSMKNAINVLALRTKGKVDDGCILCAPSTKLMRYSLK
jgi:hypothetical protein